MDVSSLNELATNLLDKARTSSAGRAAQTVHGGQKHQLRQTVIAIAADNVLAEHDSPGEATILVLTGRVKLESVSGSVEGGVGDFMLIPPERHSLAAPEDAAVLLTVVVQ